MMTDQIHEKDEFSDPGGIWKTATAKCSLVSTYIVFLLLATMISFCGFGWFAWRLYGEFRDSDNRYNQITELNKRISNLDKALAFMIHTSVETGYLDYTEFHNELEGQLNSAIQELRDLAPKTFETQALGAVSGAKSELLRMEHQVFQLVGLGNSKAALHLLESDNYVEQKSVYMDNLKQYGQDLAKLTIAESTKKQKMALGVILVGFIELLLVSHASFANQIRKRITERKEASDVISAAYRDLQNTNRELIETQAQIIQNEKLAAIGQLAAGVAHEMNTPVGFVASNFETMENYLNKFLSLLSAYEKLAEEIAETPGENDLLSKIDHITKLKDELKIDFILEDIELLFSDSKEGLGRVIDIIKSLKDFARIDEIQEMHEYSLGDGIRSTLVVARNELKHCVRVKTELSDIPKVSCHSGQINQVFLNLLLNAAQAIQTMQREEKGLITIKTYSTENEVVCEIADDGPGIPAESLSKIFDPFFTTKPAGKGTGLGLSVSHDIIVKKHKGTIHVDSVVDQGTTFTIKLPLGREIKEENGEVIYHEHENCVVCR
ncbi:MAG TPA: GHKL domain-containing protein [bacterium]|nr:GHKL domain-containing protein [bacterium]